jgi:hypothetical protein
MFEVGIIMLILSFWSFIVSMIVVDEDTAADLISLTVGLGFLGFVLTMGYVGLKAI